MLLLLDLTQLIERLFLKICYFSFYTEHESLLRSASSQKERNNPPPASLYVHCSPSQRDRNREGGRPGIQFLVPSTRPGTLGSTDLAYTPEGRAGGPGPGILHPRCGHGVHTFQQGSWVGGRGFRSERAQRLVVNAQWLLGVPVEFTWLTLVILPGFLSDGQSPFCSVLTVGKPGGLRAHGQPSAPSIRGFRQHPSGWGRRARCVVSCFGSNTLLSCSHGGFPQSLELSGAERKGGAGQLKSQVPDNRLLCLRRTVFLCVSPGLCVPPFSRSLSRFSSDVYTSCPALPPKMPGTVLADSDSEFIFSHPSASRVLLLPTLKTDFTISRLLEVTFSGAISFK